MTIEIMSKEFSEIREMLNEILERLPKCLTGKSKEVLNANEVKGILGCSDGTLNNYRKSGLLTGKKVGGRYYYSHADLNNLLHLEKGGNDGK